MLKKILALKKLYEGNLVFVDIQVDHTELQAEHFDRRFSERARICIGFCLETPDLTNASVDGRRKEVGGDPSTTSRVWPASEDEC